MVEKKIENGMEWRTEKDSIGTKEIPEDVYYGVQSLRAAENFRITGLSMHPEIINSLAQIKKAAAITNCEVGLLEKKIADAIVKACDEIIEGKLHDEFIVDPIQGGAGTSINMNANEVIANRAIELLGGEKGDYSIVHPNDHVNCGQSTNDVIPTAGKITSLKLLKNAKKELERLYKAFCEKAEEFDGIIKMGRTQMQDAVPIRLGQEFKAYSAAIRRDINRMEIAQEEMKTLNMGGTAIGTGINADEKYLRRIVPNLAEITGMDLVQAYDLIDATQNLDPFVSVSGAVKACAVTLSKIANDFRLMSSGPRCGFGEINLPAKQNGSSIMPGKVNPVIPEVVNQVAFNIIGNDMTITMAAEAGQLELNAFEPITFYCLFQSIDTLAYAVETFVDNCVSGITANKERCKQLVENSVGIVTALSPHIGYAKAASLAKEALKTGISIRELTLKDGILSEAELNDILDVKNMTEPGISGRELLLKKK
ncbi:MULTISPECIES: aspartate ammonia-lyase [Lachnospiraceae]|uniref:Aspartate ammonia-lyase n=2 Tax=Lachnospiraceae TaxID=186803 RepID=A0ABT2T9W3_9FIRM|nr:MULTISPECIES: aspartate ammonia-lyase [Lachnospiraceae]MCU6747074.1 aspartate ammonia-lyase [Faecalicatena acetigenes]SCH61664.1 Aspartate ammonia-lyase [uncultured Clostridium sp.]